MMLSSAPRFSAGLSAGSLLRSTVSEVASAGAFAVAVAAVSAAVGCAAWSLDISLIQAGDVTGCASTVFLASLMPGFFAGWIFFLVRRIAWSGPGAALATGASTAALAVVAHHNVLRSTFFDACSDSPSSAWIAAALGQSPRGGDMALTSLLVAEVAVVVVVATATLLVQRRVARLRRALPAAAPHADAAVA